MFKRPPKTAVSGDQKEVHIDRFYPGDVLRDRYEIVRFLGRGGMGEVYEALDRRRDELPVAIKTVITKLLGSAKVIQRFRREIELSRRISHPNVLHIYDVFELGEEPGNRDARGRAAPCMVMELLGGETLADRMEVGKVYTPEEARPIVSQISKALAAAHAADVVHRDLKPDNIFLVDETGELRVVLTDFGVARPNSGGKEEAFTATDVIVGTPTYMAPEQLELEDAMPVSDIYTLGLVMFEMLTGKFPFEGDTAIQIVFKRVQEDPPSPRIYLPDLDDTWEELIMSCLERDPHERLPRAELIVNRLESGAGDSGKQGGKWWWPFTAGKAS